MPDAVTFSGAFIGPGTWRSVPAYVWPRRAGPSCAGLPASRHAHRSAIGQRTQAGPQARPTGTGFGARLRYAFDNSMARGTPALIAWL